MSAILQWKALVKVKDNELGVQILFRLADSYVRVRRQKNGVFYLSTCINGVSDTKNRTITTPWPSVL